MSSDSEPMAHNFDDVEPLELDSLPVCNILYDDDYRQVMGLLLALMKRKEYSERAFALSEEAIDLLASHYLVWIYRFDILTHLNKDPVAELDWCEQIALDNEKNYQIWNYRQLLINHILETGVDFNPKREMPLIGTMLASDAKNHHVWLYRWWLVQKFELYGDAGEVEWTTLLISVDLRNNSAWSHRYSVLFAREPLPETVESELTFVESAIDRCPQNPLTWNYMRAIYRKFEPDWSRLDLFARRHSDDCTFAVEVMAAMTDKEHAADHYARLKILDPIRAPYWDALTT